MAAIMAFKHLGANSTVAQWLWHLAAALYQDFSAVAKQSRAATWRTLHQE
jgi:hypothetical protein